MCTSPKLLHCFNELISAMSTASSDESEPETEEIDDNEISKRSGSKQVVKMVVRKPIATTPISILIESLVKNLCTMIETDEERALKVYNIICNKLFEMKLIDESYQMTEFEGMRTQYQKALYHLVTAARGSEEPIAVKQRWPSENISSEWSHYQREFDELEYIAGGGFGQVFRVRHKLDGSEYAVKKIYIRSNGIKSVTDYLSEVKTFASLNHSNIVQYKAAWLELGIPSTKTALVVSKDNSDNDLSFDIDKELHYSKHVYATTQTVSEINEKLKSASSEFTVEFESHKSKQYSVSNSNISIKSQRKVVDRESRNSISEGGKAICKFNFDEARSYDQLHGEKWATLYIQMALCQITLKQWLDKRNDSEMSEVALVSITSKVRREMILKILQQILRGIQYIHSKGIVHHDIKPSNIFIQVDGANLCVQLGDFGLACPLQSTRHSLAFGTKLYAAPEQLAGKCNPKSDMYSLGIVLLELVETFSTDMERVHHITELRKGRLSSQLSAHEPQLTHIISQLVSRQVNTRPTARELLERLTVPSDDSVQVRDLKLRLVEKDLEISRLKELLKSAGVHI
ncbi:pancreatic eIF-2alpha kinase [Carabus blaptoides fortunei]